MKLTCKQKSAITFALNNKRVMLALETGVGKTLVGINILEKTQGEKLIISTPLIIKEVWGEVEADKTTFMKSKNITKKYDVVIVDEATKTSNSSTQTFKSVYRICKNAEYVVLLTGSVAGRELINMWGMYKIIDDGMRLGKTKTSFLKNYMYPIDRTRGIYKPKKGCVSEAARAVRDITYYADNSDLVPSHTIKHALFNTSALQKSYIESMKKHGILKINNQNISAAYGQRAAKISQIESGFIIDNNGYTIKFKNNPKIAALKKIVQGKRAIIAYRYIQERIDIHKHLSKIMDIKDPEACEKWNNQEIDAITMNINGEIYGLNLQFGGNMVVWYHTTCSHERFEQLNARLLRRGQKNQVEIIQMKHAPYGLKESQKYSQAVIGSLISDASSH